MEYGNINEILYSIMIRDITSQRKEKNKGLTSFVGTKSQLLKKINANEKYDNHN